MMLEFKNVRKSFGEGQTRKIVFEDLNFKVDKGEFVTIIGGNGAGKSTLMDLIAGSKVSDQGKILIEGKNITSMSEHRRARFIGRVFQDPFRGTAPNMTVEENLSLAYMKGKRKTLRFAVNKNMRDFFRSKLCELGLGLEDRLDTKIGLLSGGQRQAITLVMATFVKPKLLLLDEHTAALDPDSSERIMDITRRITSEHGITTLMITHRLDTVRDEDTVFVLECGDIKEKCY